MAVESTSEAAGLPDPEGWEVKTSSASYVVAKRNATIDLSHDRLTPSASLTLIDSKYGASHLEKGRYVIDKDLEKCGAFHCDKVKLCLFPNDGQSYTKDIQASKISGDGTRKSYVGVGCDALYTSDTLGCVDSGEKRESGTEATSEKKEDINKCLVKNPGKSCRANNSSYPCFDTQSELSTHLKTHLRSGNLYVGAELSMAQEESIKTIVSAEESDASCQPTTSNTMGGIRRKRRGMRGKGNGPIKDNSEGMGERKNVRKSRKVVAVNRKLCTQNLSCKSHSCVEHRRDQPSGSSMKRVHSCSVCAKTFTQSGILSKHMLTHVREKSYSCVICEKYFSRSNHLNEHMRTHTGEKPFSCDVCNKSFSRKSNLVMHCRTHTGERPYACSICRKSFYQGCDLTKHVRTHSGEKPYLCNLCGNSFTQRSSLDAHMFTHTGEKPFSCDVCSKAFSTKKHLVIHCRTHTGVRPFSCSICRKSFYQSSDLTKHKRTHTGEKPYLCDVCSKSFSQKFSLDRHKHTHT